MTILRYIKADAEKVPKTIGYKLRSMNINSKLICPIRFFIKADAKRVPKTVGYKINHNLAAIEDQEEALTKPGWAYYFALKVPEADIRKCEEAACEDPMWAYTFARDIPGADIKKCEESACNSSGWAYYFACYVAPAQGTRKTAKR